MQDDGSVSHDPLLREILNRLVDAYRPERLCLFGSRARRDSGSDSDYDLLVVVPDDADPPRKRSRLAYEVLWTTGAAVGVIVLTRSRFEERLSVKASLSAIVASKGRLLYAA